jgi:tripartite-type tricarboxylate transporter receptor subunit TctC
MALFASQAKVQMTHVPYKGATQAAVGLGGKEVDASFQGFPTVAPLLKAGKLRLIGVTTARKMPQFPDVPTVSESGQLGFEFSTWFTLMAPAGTPRPILQYLSAEAAKAVADPEVRDKLIAQGMTPRGSSPEELGRATREQLVRYADLIRQSGIKAD